MLSWGCEFLDIEQHKEFVNIEKSIIQIEMDFLSKTIDDLYTQSLLKNNLRYIESLSDDIRINGIKQPGILVISPTKIKLQDGNHRYLAAVKLRLSHFPVVIQYSDGKMNAGVTLQELAKEMICSMYSRNIS